MLLFAILDVILSVALLPLIGLFGRIRIGIWAPPSAHAVAPLQSAVRRMSRTILNVSENVPNVSVLTTRFSLSL